MGFRERPAVLAVLAAALSVADAANVRAHLDPYKTVGATLSEPSEAETPRNFRTSLYMVATFPAIKQVAYVQLPDNVWRPLVVGNITNPQGVAVDGQGKRLFVSDPTDNVIWAFGLTKRDGFLETVYPRIAAVEGFSAKWLAVNSIGDLYFTGRQAGSSDGVDSIYRQDADKIVAGDSMNPVAVYDRANTGKPDPKAWAPSGLAVDAFYVYWGNQESGTVHGSVVKGTRPKTALLSSSASLVQLSSAVSEVRGMCATGTNLFYLTPTGVYGMPKTTSTSVTDAQEGLIAEDPAGANSSTPWSPTSIAWDGESSLYFTDSNQGKIYSLPSDNTAKHQLTAFVDAPGIHGVSIMSFHTATHSSHGNIVAVGWAPVLAASLALLLRQ